MRLWNWLENVIHRLNVGRHNTIVRRRTQSKFLKTVGVEQLETRRLLSGAPVKGGVEALVNSSTAGDQYHSAVAMDAGGDYVVVYQSVTSRYDYDLYAQRFNAAGSAQGGPTFVTNISRDNTFPSVAIDDQGDFVVAWNGMAQRFDSTGTAVGNLLHVSTNVNPRVATTSVAMDSTGDFVVSWFEYGTNHDAVWAQRYNSSGVPQGANFQVSAVTDNFGPFLTPPIPVSTAMDSSGKFVIAYSNSDAQGNVFVKRYDAAGVLQGTAQANTNTTFNQQVRGVALDTAGDLVVTWQSYLHNGGSQNGIYAQRYNGAGTAQGANFQVYQAGTFTGYSPSSAIAPIIEAPVSMDSTGDFAIAWTNEPDGSGPGVFVQSYNAAGTAQGSPVTVNTYTTGIQSSPSIGMDSAGDFVVAWSSEGQVGTPYRWDVYSQQFFAAATPRLLQIEGTPLAVFGSLFTPVTSTLNVFDGQAANWTGATVKFSNNYQNGQDVLVFTNTANISGSFNASTGTLTLTGTDSIANYRAALRSVTYHNTSGSPNTAVTRTISFQATNGTSQSNIATRDLALNATSHPPTVTNVSSSEYYVSGTTPLPLGPNLIVTDIDGLNIVSATVSFTNWQAGDRLAFLNSFALQHTFVEDLTSHTATLTLTGSDTPAHYQATLRSVVFSNVAGQPNTSAIRVAMITVNDPLNSGSATTNVSVTPYLSGLNATVNYLQGSSPLPIAPNLVVVPPAGLNIQSATVSFTNWQGEDRLAFYNSLALQHTFTQDLVAHTATLTISGSASGAGYQTLLRSVTFQDVAGNPIATTRVAKITVNDGTNQVSASENVTVTPAKQPPLVQINDSTPLTYKANSPAIAIMGLALVSDPDSNNLTQMTIQISSGYQNNVNGHDLLNFVNQNGITGSYNATTGTLTLSGSSYAGNYRQALRSVTFNTTGSSISLAARTFTVIATDDSNTASAPVSRSITVTM